MIELDELLVRVESSIEDVKRKFYGVVTGTVQSTDDPLHLGRVQVTLPFLDDEDPAPWARLAAPFAGRLSGHYFVPEVEDTVLVAFEQGDTSVPYVIGSLWHGMAPPPVESPDDGVRAIRTPVGNQVVFEERPPTVTIQTGPTPPLELPADPSSTGPHHTIRLGPSGIDAKTPTAITLEVAQSKIEITPAGITLSIGGSKVSLDAGGVTIEAAASITIKASGTVTVQGSLVRIN
jgi:phage baseplate assembly protein gpV